MKNGNKRELTAFIFDGIFLNLAGNKDDHISLDEF